MNAASLPSGDTTLLGGVARRSPLAHCLPCTSQVQRLRSVSNEKCWRLSSNVICTNGNRVALIGRPNAVVSAAATAAWSKAGALVPPSASTSMNSLPVAIWLRYQKRSPGSQFGLTAPFDTSGVVL